MHAVCDQRARLVVLQAGVEKAKTSATDRATPNELRCRRVWKRKKTARIDVFYRGVKVDDLHVLGRDTQLPGYAGDRSLETASARKFEEYFLHEDDGRQDHRGADGKERVAPATMSLDRVPVIALDDLEILVQVGVAFMKNAEGSVHRPTRIERRDRRTDEIDNEDQAENEENRPLRGRDPGRYCWPPHRYSLSSHGISAFSPLRSRIESSSPRHGAPRRDLA